MRLRKELLLAKGHIAQLYHKARLIGEEEMIEFYDKVLEIYRKEGL